MRGTHNKCAQQQQAAAARRSPCQRRWKSPPRQSITLGRYPRRHHPSPRSREEAIPPCCQEEARLRRYRHEAPLPCPHTLLVLLLHHPHEATPLPCPHTLLVLLVLLLHHPHQPVPLTNWPMCVAFPPRLVGARHLPPQPTSNVAAPCPTKEFHSSTPWGQPTLARRKTPFAK
jgi:hypothetical protein